MIASVTFRNFKALRNASVQLGPFNLVIGPNGSGKTSLIEALLQLRSLSNLVPIDAEIAPPTASHLPDFTFRFKPPHDDLEVRLGCVDDVACNALHVSPPQYPGWNEVRVELSLVRSYVFDHRAMAQTARRDGGDELSSNGANLAAVLHRLQSHAPAAFAAVVVPRCAGKSTP